MRLAPRQCLHIRKAVHGCLFSGAIAIITTIRSSSSETASSPYLIMNLETQLVWRWTRPTNSPGGMSSTASNLASRDGCSTAVGGARASPPSPLAAAGAWCLSKAPRFNNHNLIVTILAFQGDLLTSGVTNFGRYTDDEGQVVPRFRLEIGWQWTERLGLHAGYNLIVWDGIVQAADHLPPEPGSRPAQLPGPQSWRRRRADFPRHSQHDAGDPRPRLRARAKLLGSPASADWRLAAAPVRPTSRPMPLPPARSSPPPITPPPIGDGSSCGRSSWLLAVGILAYLFHRLRGEDVFQRLIDEPKHWGFLAVAQALVLVALTINYVRWYVLGHALALDFYASRRAAAGLARPAAQPGVAAAASAATCSRPCSSPASSRASGPRRWPAC